jgi:hypothetical protein
MNSFKKRLGSILVLTLCFAVAGKVNAQGSDGNLRLSKSGAAAISEQAKSPVVAGLAEAALPFAGGLYVGEVKPLMVPGVLHAGGLLMLIGGTASAVSDGSMGGAAVAGLGVVAYTVGAVWGGIKAYHLAGDHNQRLGLSLNLSRGMERGSYGVGVSIPTKF